MTDTGAVVGTPKIKSLKLKAKSAKKGSSHPPTASLVINAIKHLNERGGSSLQAIKKYISSTYKIDAEKIAPFVKKYLKSAVEKGVLMRTKGTGASGSFKLATAKVEGVKAKAKATKKTSKPKKAGKKPKSKPKKAKKVSKAKKATKAPAAKKPKAPKPKKAAKKVAKKAAKK